MTLWWMGNAVLLFVVLPAVIALLNRVLAAAVERVRTSADNILPHGVELMAGLTNVPALLATARQVAVGVTRYAGTVAKLLPAK